MRGVSEKSWSSANLKVLTSTAPREVFIKAIDRADAEQSYYFEATDNEGRTVATCDSSNVLSKWAFSEGAWAVHHRYDLKKER